MITEIARAAYSAVLLVFSTSTYDISVTQFAAGAMFIMPAYITPFTLNTKKTFFVMFTDRRASTLFAFASLSSMNTHTNPTTIKAQVASFAMNTLGTFAPFLGYVFTLATSAFLYIVYTHADASAFSASGFLSIMWTFISLAVSFALLRYFRCYLATTPINKNV